MTRIGILEAIDNQPGMKADELEYKIFGLLFGEPDNVRYDEQELEPKMLERRAQALMAVLQAIDANRRPPGLHLIPGLHEG